MGGDAIRHHDRNVPRIRLRTFNLLAAAHAGGRDRSDVVKRAIAGLHPDVVAFQEVTRTPSYDQAVDLLGRDFEIVDHPSPFADGVGACLASRWPLRGVETLDLHVSPDVDGLPWAAAVAAEVEAPMGSLVVVHHKPNWQLDREHVREQRQSRPRASSSGSSTAAPACRWF